MNNESQTKATKSVVPREAVATPGDVQKFLTLTDEQVEEIRKEQALQLYRSRAILTKAERNRGRGVELERHHRITKDKNGLAEALALQGKYEEAYKAAKNPVLKKELKEKAAAVSKEDVDCKCDSFEEIGGYNLPTQHVEFYGYSTKHKGVVPFIRCNRCGILNAMANLPHLEKQKDLRNSKTATDKDRQDFFKL